jgi:ABC-type glycerol-3-phosphate transport system permease component
MLSGALRSEAEMFRYSATLSLWTFIPREPTMAAFLQLPGREFFFLQLGNTVLMGLVLASSSTLVTILAAYPLARLRFPGRQSIFFAMVATIFIPLDVIISPLYLAVRDLNLANTFWGLLLPWIFSPLSIYLMRQAMQDIPVEQEEAAIIDGAGLLQILRYIIVPNVIPAIITVWLLNFMFVWDWFLWPLVAMQEPGGQMVQVGIASFFSPLIRTNFAQVFAASVVATLPVFVVFLALQRFFMQTMAFSGGK